MKLGDVLRKERETKGLTAEEISKRLGVPPDEYKAIEAGDSPLEKAIIYLTHQCFHGTIRV